MSNELRHLPGPATRDHKGRFVKRNSKGQVVKGSAGINPTGKSALPYSSKASREVLAQGSGRALEVMLEMLDAPDRWQRLRAAEFILLRTLFHHEDGQPQDTEFIRWATEEELKQLGEIIARCNARRERGEAEWSPPRPTPTEVINTTAKPITDTPSTDQADPSGSTGDAPAAEPSTPDPDEWEVIDEGE